MINSLYWTWSGTNTITDEYFSALIDLPIERKDEEDEEEKYIKNNWID